MSRELCGLLSVGFPEGEVKVTAVRLAVLRSQPSLVVIRGPLATVDLRTVQQWLGHSDMESTMRYLKPSRSKQTREKVNEIFAL